MHTELKETFLMPDINVNDIVTLTFKSNYLFYTLLSLWAFAKHKHRHILFVEYDALEAHMLYNHNVHIHEYRVNCTIW